MRYIQVVKEFLPSALKEVEKNILNDYETLEFVQDKNQLKQLLKRQSELLMKYFSNFPEGSKINLEEIRNFYQGLDIPYIVIDKSIDNLKTKFLERIALEKELKSEEFLLSVKEYIEKLQNKIAYFYLQKEAKNIDLNSKKAFSKYLLYSSKQKYMQDIIDSILNNDLKIFPVVKATECEFHRYIYYPESLMVCTDASLCNHIEELHKVIHNIANSLYIFLTKENYREAYLAFINLKESYLKLSTTLAELYFLTFVDIESQFFNLLEYLEHQPDDKYVYIVDIQKLKQLNSLYSEEKVSQAIKEIEKDLNEWIFPQKDKYILVKGVTANFYLLAVNIDEKQALENIDKIKNIVEREFKFNGQNRKISVSIGLLKLSRNLIFTKKELLKILLYLKEKAKKNLNNVSFAVNETQIKEIIEFINKKYRDINYITEKINKKEIEVVFQPIYDSKTRDIVALESLLRIKKEDGSLIPAGLFIDSILEAGLIHKIDSLVLEKITEKKDMIKKITDTIFINVSPDSLRSSEYINKLKSFLKHMNNFQVIMELTEQKLVEDIEVVNNLESEFKNLHFAIDDFGSGYSSLKFVAEMAEKELLKVLKIDGSLIKNAINEEITLKLLKVISAMIKSLEIKAVAEFVEDEETLNLLANLDIDYSQGFYLSKPKPVEEILLMSLTE